MSLTRAGGVLVVVALLVHSLYLIAAGLSVVFGVPLDLRRAEWGDGRLLILNASLYGGALIVAGSLFGLAAYRRVRDRRMPAATASALFLLAAVVVLREQIAIALVEFALAVLSFVAWEHRLEDGSANGTATIQRGHRRLGTWEMLRRAIGMLA